MRAMICDAIRDTIGGLKLADLPTPEPDPGEVRVRLRAAAVNFPDLLMLQGKYQFKPALPFIPGVEGAGEIAALGAGVDTLRLGERVMVGARLGTYAEAIVVPANAVRAIPATFDFAEAAAFRAAYNTAYVALVRRGNLRTGETLLVHGASGGVGLAAVELGRHLGATVIATAGSDDKLAIVTAKGAHHVINYTTSEGKLGGFREAVKALTQGRGADVIYDPVGGDVFDESVRCIAPEGRLLVIGFAGGRIPTVGVNMPLIKEFSIIGVRAGEYGRRHPEQGRENLDALDALANAGKLRPHIFARLPLEQGNEAQALLATRKVIGKVVLEM